MASIEIEWMRELVQEGGRGYFMGSRSWLCDSAETGSISRALYDTRWGSSTGDPICKKTRASWMPSGIPSLSMVTAYYSTAREIGKARLTTKTKSDWRKIIAEPSGEKRIIEGPDPINQLAWWSVVQGDNVVQDFQTMIAIQTAASSDGFYLRSVLDLAHCVNKGSLTIEGFGTVDSGSLLMVGVDTSQEYGAGLVDLDYLMLWSGSGPNSERSAATIQPDR